MTDDSFIKLLAGIVKYYNISVSHHSIELTILTHPDYPSMRCISDAFDSWKVKHVVARLSLEKLRALDVPVIAHLKTGEFVWVTLITDTKVHYRNGSGKGNAELHNNFERQWSGATLAIGNIDEAGEPDYRKKRSREVKENIVGYAFAGGCIALLTVLTCFTWTNDGSLPLLPKALLLLVNAAGCYIGYTLIGQEKRQANRLAQKFCKAGVFIDCNKVTKSHYSKLFGLFSWAELGMAYFVAVTLWVAIAPASNDWLYPLWWFLLAPLPFTLWSLFTQAFLIRKWCLFCCFIVILLWINACLLYFFIPFVCVVPVIESALAVLLLLVCTAAVLYAGKTKLSDPYSEQRETARIKYDFKTLQAHLSEFRQETGNAGFVWGDPQARHEITLYVSIACSHCGKAVKALKGLTDTYPDLCFRLIFAVNTDDFEHKSTVITRHFISLHKTMHKDAFFDMLDAWYTTLNKNLEALQKAYPAVSAQEGKEEIDALYRFSQQAKTGYTPAILLNGRVLSQLYSHSDLFGIARTLYTEEDSG